MNRPAASSSRNVSHVAHCGTRFELAISTRGACSCVSKTATGLPDWTSSVSVSPSVVSSRLIVARLVLSRAALPIPP
jgi:hypothetical protein